MAGAVWDMHTAGALAGQVKSPLVRTTTEEDSIRVQVYLDLATEFGEWTLNTERGVPSRRMLLSDVTDEERAAYVRDEILFRDRRPRPGVASAAAEVETELPDATNLLGRLVREPVHEHVGNTMSDDVQAGVPEKLLLEDVAEPEPVRCAH